MGIRRFLWRSMVLSASIIVVCSGNAAGAGVAIMEQSVRQLGIAFAGGAAAADDATTIFYNPAGLTRLSQSQSLVGTHLIFPAARFENAGSTDLSGGFLQGGDGGNAGSSILIPNMYFSHKFSDRLDVGVGIFSPFGLSTNYGSSWVGRYHAVKSDLVSVNINPAVAWRLTDKLSLGAGINAQYLKSELSNAIDFGAIFATFGAPGMTLQGNDGTVTFKGDSWSWGYNVGTLYEFTPATRAGIAYRSRIVHTLTGDADFSGVPAIPTGRFLDGGIRSDVTLPDSLSVSLWHNFSPEVAATADMTWTGWSTVKELRIRFDNSLENDAVTTLGWKDTLRWSLGAVYMPGAWTVRTGLSYEQSPVPNAAHRSPRVPDNDRIWLCGGVGYKINETWSVDAGYAHLFVKDAEIQKSATGENTFRGALSGSYRSDADIVSVGVVKKF